MPFCPFEERLASEPRIGITKCRGRLRRIVGRACHAELVGPIQLGLPSCPCHVGNLRAARRSGLAKGLHDRLRVREEPIQQNRLVGGIAGEDCIERYRRSPVAQATQSFIDLRSRFRLVGPERDNTVLANQSSNLRSFDGSRFVSLAGQAPVGREIDEYGLATVDKLLESVFRKRLPGDAAEIVAGERRCLPGGISHSK